jgi:hypothetical protein
MAMESQSNSKVEQGKERSGREEGYHRAREGRPWWGYQVEVERDGYQQQGSSIHRHSERIRSR